MHLNYQVNTIKLIRNELFKLRRVLRIEKVTFVISSLLKGKPSSIHTPTTSCPFGCNSLPKINFHQFLHDGIYPSKELVHARMQEPVNNNKVPK